MTRPLKRAQLPAGPCALDPRGQLYAAAGASRRGPSAPPPGRRRGWRPRAPSRQQPRCAACSPVGPRAPSRYFPRPSTSATTAQSSHNPSTRPSSSPPASRTMTWARQPGTPSRSSRTNEYDSSQVSRRPSVIASASRARGTPVQRRWILEVVLHLPYRGPPLVEYRVHEGDRGSQRQRAQAVGGSPLHRRHPYAEVLDDRRHAGVGVVDHHPVGRLPRPVARPEPGEVHRAGRAERHRQAQQRRGGEVADRMVVGEGGGDRPDPADLAACGRPRAGPAAGTGRGAPAGPARCAPAVPAPCR